MSPYRGSMESGSAGAAAKAVWKRAPTVILRPAIGVSKAVGQTLLGAGNTLDPSNRRKMEDVSGFTTSRLVPTPGTSRGFCLRGVWLTIFYRSINVTDWRRRGWACIGQVEGTPYISFSADADRVEFDFSRALFLLLHFIAYSLRYHI